MMKLGSLFDGSGGFPLAGSLCGIEPTWAAEVEPYPIAVTRSRFLNMKHLGSVTDINGAEIEPVDLITFGSPCQDLSVAGKRAGLKHEANGDDETTRSGLFMEAVRIIKEMRDATNGRYPTFALWENVPGAFSSNHGEDFRTVLEELIRIVEPTAVMPDVPKAGWPYADSYRGDGWSLAYRVFDAQYIRTAQRRKRVYLVLDLRGERAGKILFEREGVRGYFAQGRTPWQGTAYDSKGSTETDDRKTVCLDDQGGQQINVRTDGKCPTLRAEAHGNLPSVMVKTYDARGNGGGVVCEPIPIHDQATRFDGKRGDKADGKGNGFGVGHPGEPMNTLTSADRHAVAYCMGNGQLNQMSMAEQSNCLDCMHDKQAVVIASGVDCRNATEYPELNGTLQAKANGGFSYNCNQVVRVRYIVRRLTPTECARLQGFPDKWGHPDRKDGFTDEEYQFWFNVRNTHAAINEKAVKQYTKEQMLKWYNGLHTDSAEYKMWGNGIALPPALYCMQGIAEALSEDNE